MRLAALVLLLLAPLSMAAQPAILPAAANAPLTVSFNSQGIHVAGVTPRGQVVIVSSMREASRQMLVRMTGVQQLLTDTSSGAVDFDLGRPIPERSIWAAVDVTSGRYAVVTPAGFPRQELSFPATGVRNTAAVEADDQLLNDHFLLEMLWVHPQNGNGGAWFGRVADGGSTDVDGKNDGRTLTNTSQFAPIGTSGTPPKKFRNGDVLVFIDPLELQFFATAVTK